MTALRLAAVFALASAPAQGVAPGPGRDVALAPDDDVAVAPRHDVAVAPGHDVAERCHRLAKELPELLGIAEIPGASIAVASRAGVVWSAGFGVRDRATGAPVDADTVFEAASLSKPVFAYAVMQLVDSGVLDLDTPLAEYARYPDVEHDPRHERITARRVLSHTTGLPNWRPQGGRLEFEYEPGERWRYSGEGFVMLQSVVEQLVGDPLEEICRQLVFEPLGMERSSYVWRDRFEDDFALPHGEDGSVRENRRMTRGNAAFSLLTTASDYARFLAAIMRGDRLRERTWREMLTTQADVNTGVTWGLGWGLEENEDGLAFWHWGHNSGYRAYAIAYPARDFALVYLTDGDNGMRLLREVLCVATGDEDHPALHHLDYESYDSARLVVSREVMRSTLAEGAEAGIARYLELKEEQPPEAFAESLLESIGSRLLHEHGRVEDAIGILTLNADEYPESYRAQDDLGAAFLAHGDLEEALSCYERAVALNAQYEAGKQKIRSIRARIDGKERAGGADSPASRGRAGESTVNGFVTP